MIPSFRNQPIDSTRKMRPEDQDGECDEPALRVVQCKEPLVASRRIS
jgi:hypothetical protein